VIAALADPSIKNKSHMITKICDTNVPKRQTNKRGLTASEGFKVDEEFIAQSLGRNSKRNKVKS